MHSLHNVHAGKCPDGWQPSDVSCYKVVDSKVNFDEGAKLCRSQVQEGQTERGFPWVRGAGEITTGPS
jgi:hypothetical protein